MTNSSQLNQVYYYGYVSKINMRYVGYASLCLYLLVSHIYYIYSLCSPIPVARYLVHYHMYGGLLGLVVITSMV